MLTFILAALVMTVIAMLFVLLPLWRRPSVIPAALDSSNLAVLRNRRSELDDELHRGAIDSMEYDEAIAALSVQALDEIPATAVDAPSVQPARPFFLIVALATLLPVTAALLYAKLGSPPGNMVAAPTADNSAAPSAAPMSDPQILAMVDSLAKKMEQNPSDPKGWVLLARSQAALGRFTDAKKSYERLIALIAPGPELAQHYADYADVLAVLQQGKFDSNIMAMIQKALAMDANNVKALALAASVEMQRKDGKAALIYWQRLQKLTPKGSQEENEVANIIAQIKGQPAIPFAGNTTIENGPVAVTNVEAASVANSNTSIEGIASLDPALRSKLAPTDSLFILARAKDGPKMPLAVMRISASELPKKFELNDAMAMTPAMKLSAFKEVVIEARVSKSGNATLASGDLSGVSTVVSPGARNVNIVITNIAP